MSRLFNQGQRTHVKKNVFDLSHERKLSFNMGQIVPIYLQEIVPGDKFKVSTESLVRLAPMLAPMMHRVNIHTHFFFVPNRLVYDKWQDFITGGPDSTLAPALPKIQITEANKSWFQKGSLLDYFGVTPVDVTKTITAPTELNALPFRAYQMIWHEYFRDQTLTPGYEFSTGETIPAGEEQVLNQLRTRCWEKDYFTSALPWAQRGPEVLIPTLPSGVSGVQYRNPTRYLYMEAGSPPVENTSHAITDDTNTGNIRSSMDENRKIIIDNIVSVPTTLAAEVGTINDLRKAARLQEWFEKNARAGARYIEQIMAHFGVRSSDARLQRPEFLGGGINPVVVSEVLSTYGSTEVPQGNMSGHGISVGHDNNFTKFFEEHGYVIGVMSVLPRTAYQQGIPRPFLKNDRYDFFWPEFANIGEQPVMDQELFHDYTTGNGSSVFGYQSRYAEYKFQPNVVCGEFRDTLNYWHMGRIFDNKPALNTEFVEALPTHRNFAVTDEAEHKLYVQIYNKVTAIRPMPMFGTPQL